MPNMHKSGTMSIHRPRYRCRHTPPPEPLWRLLHHRPQRLHALVRRALASSMIAIDTVDRGRRLVRGQDLQPERRYRRCLRDDPHMPRQASPVPAGSHPRASLHSASHTGAPLEHATVAHGPRIALYKDFFFPRLRFLFLFCFYFSPLTGDFSHIFFP